ncbi:hypothetical protein MNBD_ALPHA02-1776 [hydrothermal vent metagenome]|uniref:DUF547 domain-containing protein n=1 Tax=hydrothermal vent metagenome TaxID=652676 RepID=A0A3B0RUI7_9ZZZZ
MTYQSSRFYLKWIIILIFFNIFSPFHVSYAQVQNEQDAVKIATYDPSSRITVNYGNLTLLLQSTVTRARISSRIYAQKSTTSIGTKINYSNNNPSRMEASRTFYHYIGEEELEYVLLLRQAMEALPQAVPLQYLNRNEQLAYWLNLYNITVYEQLARRYPIRKLKKLHNGSRKTPSMWDEKILKVNGIALSLNDIQYNIIEKTWRNPLVIYGLYQGTIGGPNMRRKAYTGRLVYEQLEDNAEEFVNSLRGLRFKGKEAHVSKIYDWNRDLFPDFKNDLRRHLRKYANLRLVTRLDSSRKIKVKFYDWHIADVLNGGRTPPGSSGSTNPVAMLLSFGNMESENSNGGLTSSNPVNDPSFNSGKFSGFGAAHSKKVMDTAIIRDRLPLNAAAFLKEFVERNRKLKATRVTVEEIEKKDLEKIKKQKK